MSKAQPGIGHNNGPTMERGHRWRTYQWRRAQAKLMPKTMPLMIVKMRVRRAAELGMDYKTYASIRQASGQDIMALLFSSNALRIIGDGARMPDGEARVLGAVKSAQKLSLVHRPHLPEAVLRANPVVDAASAAPRFTDSWSLMRQQLESFIRVRAVAGNQVVIVGDTSLEADWVTAAKAAGYVPAARYFVHQAAPGGAG